MLRGSWGGRTFHNSNNPYPPTIYKTVRWQVESLCRENRLAPGKSSGSRPSPAPGMPDPQKRRSGPRVSVLDCACPLALSLKRRGWGQEELARRAKGEEG